MAATATAFEAEVASNPELELERDRFGGLAQAIAEAAMAAAAEMSSEDPPRYFEITSIQIKVEPNPGPTAYKVGMKAVSS